MINELEQFVRSNIPKQIQIDDTDNCRAGMKVNYQGSEADYVIIDVLSECDITVIELGTLH